MDQEMTESQLIAALQEARGQADNAEGALTTRELAQRLGWPTSKVRDRLLELKAQGKLETVRVYRKNLAGYDQVLPGYRIIDTQTQDGDQN